MTSFLLEIAQIFLLVSFDEIRFAEVEFVMDVLFEYLLNAGRAQMIDNDLISFFCQQVVGSDVLHFSFNLMFYDILRNIEERLFHFGVATEILKSRVEGKGVNRRVKTQIGKLNSNCMEIWSNC